MVLLFNKIYEFNDFIWIFKFARISEDFKGVKLVKKLAKASRFANIRA